MWLFKIRHYFGFEDLMEIFVDSLSKYFALFTLSFNKSNNFDWLSNRKNVLYLRSKEDWDRDLNFACWKFIIKQKKVVFKLSQVNWPEYETFEPLLLARLEFFIVKLRIYFDEELIVRVI